MTDGLVSGVNRSTPAPNGASIPDAIQTSAPVNPGNSGGPLMTLDNRVIGVVNAGGGENLAFAISAALVKLVVPDLIEKGEYIHPYVGIVPVTVTPELAGRIGLDEPQGVYVESIIPDSPAAGVLESGDVIVAIGETQVTTRQQFISYLALHTSPGVSVQITVKRGGSSQTTSFTVGERPEQSESVT